MKDDIWPEVVLIYCANSYDSMYLSLTSAVEKLCVFSEAGQGLRFLLLTAALLFLPAGTITWHRGLLTDGRQHVQSAAACV